MEPRPIPSADAAGLLHGEVEPTIVEITTPRSVITEHEFMSPEVEEEAARVLPVGRVSEGSAWPSSMVTGPTSSAESSQASTIYLTKTELSDGRQALLIDPGSWGNLAGDKWVKRTAQIAMQQNKQPKQEKRAETLRVQGVGHGSQECSHDVALPIALKNTTGARTDGTFTTPTVNGSDLPALLGLKTLVDRRAILDLTTNTLHFVGPGDVTIDFPPGTESYQLHHAVSGHLMMPCCEFDAPQTLEPDSQLVSLPTEARTGEGEEVVTSE